MWVSIQNLIKYARCSIVEALETATLHPAQALKIQDKKGTLEFGSDADFVMISPDGTMIISTWIAGNCVFENQ